MSIKNDVENISRLEIMDYYGIDYGTENVVKDLLEIMFNMSIKIEELENKISAINAGNVIP